MGGREDAIIDAALVHRLLKRQFPHWADLPIAPVSPGGWDNRTFRLGDAMCVRLPSAQAYAAQVHKEHVWLPRLAPMLPLPIPSPLEMGQPDEGYPWHWSVYSWLPGEPPGPSLRGSDDLAAALARFLKALQGIETAGGPSPGAHNFFRGAALAVYDEEVRQAVAALGSRIDGPAATRAWALSLNARQEGRPVWLHGDISPGNLLVEKGALSAVIDFGSCGVGDPACDFAIAWSFFSARSRATFRSALDLDEDSWLRGRGWALWKALVVLAGRWGNDPRAVAQAGITLEEVLGDASAH